MIEPCLLIFFVVSSRDESFPQGMPAVPLSCMDYFPLLVKFLLIFALTMFFYCCQSELEQACCIYTKGHCLGFFLIQRTRHWTHHPKTARGGEGRGWCWIGFGMRERVFACTRIQTSSLSVPSPMSWPLDCMHHLLLYMAWRLSVWSVMASEIQGQWRCFFHSTWESFLRILP